MQIMKKKILLLFADFCEAEVLLQKLAFQQFSQHLYSVSYKQIQLDLCILPAWGMQGVNQIFRLYRLTHYHLWINLGFAGACQRSISLMKSYSIHQVCQLDTNVPTQLTAAPTLDLLPIPDLPVQTLVSAHKPYVYGFHNHFSLVDMEGYTIAQYAKAHHIPCMMMKLTSDYTEPKLRTHFHLMKYRLSQEIANSFLQFFPKITRNLKEQGRFTQ